MNGSIFAGDYSPRCSYDTDTDSEEGLEDPGGKKQHQWDERWGSGEVHSNKEEGGATWRYTGLPPVPHTRLLSSIAFGVGGGCKHW